MPPTKVILFREDDGRVPLLDWLDGPPSRVVAKCVVRLERFAELGHELRRPEGDYLGEGIYEIRFASRSVNFRMLYFYQGQAVAVVSHGFTKERRVPATGDHCSSPPEAPVRGGPGAPHPSGTLMTPQSSATTDAIRILHRRYVEGRPERLADCPGWRVMP
jgi:phage-related protein